MKKIARQEMCSMSQPPRTGPSAVVIAVNPDHVPMARPRERPSNEALMIERRLQSRQRDVDHSAIDESSARAEGGGGQNPRSGVCAARTGRR